MKLLLSLLVSALLFVSCSNVKPLRSLDSNPIPDGLKLTQIEKGIKAGGAARGWVFKKVKGQNELEGTLLVRQHQVVISVPYTKANYSMNYKSSQNMKYNSAKNMIHRNYYRWIQNLKNSIDMQLLQAGSVQ